MILTMFTEVITCIFLVATCIFQIILFVEFIHKYKRKINNHGKVSISLSEHILSLLVFTNIWIIYFNGGFSLSGSFLSPYEEMGEGMLLLFTPQEPILTFTVFYGMVLTLFGSTIYFIGTLIKLLKSVIKKEYKDEVAEMKTSVFLILIISFIGILLLQALVRLSN